MQQFVYIILFALFFIIVKAFYFDSKPSNTTTEINTTEINTTIETSEPVVTEPIEDKNKFSHPPKSNIEKEAEDTPIDHAMNSLADKIDEKLK